MRWMAIAFPIALLMDVLVFLNFYKWQQQSVYEFEQRQMDLQVNYAVDAAVHDMLTDGTHLNTDYATWGEMTTEPEVALDTYIAVLLRNLGWADTAQNREDLIYSSIPFFCVATYDGYYVYCKQTDVIEGHDYSGALYEYRHYPMVWTPKIPYSRTVIDDWVEDTQQLYYTTYLYNLGFSTYDTVDQSGTIKLQNDIYTGENSAPGSVADAKQVINATLTDACNNALYLGLMDITENAWYLPATFSSWSNNNPVESPTVLTYISRADGMTQYNTVTFGIGGARIDKAEFCICYNDPSYGGPLYTYSSNRELLESLYGITNIETIVPTAKEAAEKGYFFDLRFREVREADIYD